jgi:hypothetical protein
MSALRRGLVRMERVSGLMKKSEAPLASPRASEQLGTALRAAEAALWQQARDIVFRHPHPHTS